MNGEEALEQFSKNLPLLGPLCGFSNQALAGDDLWLLLEHPLMWLAYYINHGAHSHASSFYLSGESAPRLDFPVGSE